MQVSANSLGREPRPRHLCCSLDYPQVSANNLLEQEGSWRFSFRDHSAAGHDKAEALRRAQRDARPAQPKALLVGRFACDLAGVQAEAHADMCMCMHMSHVHAHVHVHVHVNMHVCMCARACA